MACHLCEVVHFKREDTTMFRWPNTTLNNAGTQVKGHRLNSGLYLAENQGNNLTEMVQLMWHIVSLLRLNNVLQSHHLVEGFFSDLVFPYCFLLPLTTLITR